MNALTTTGRSFVNRWQCDENDHLNVQFFTAFASDAQRHLETELGLGPAALAEAGLRLRRIDEHIRYHREFRAADSVEVRSGPLEIGEDRLVALHEIHNPSTGMLAATVRTTIVCESLEDGIAAWPARFANAAGARLVALPEEAKPRSVGSAGALPDLTLAEAQRRGLVEIGRSVIQPEECDTAGRMLPRFYFARYSDGAAFLWQALGFDREMMRERGFGTIVLEMRQVYRAPEAALAGLPVVVMSGALGAAAKTLHFGHFMFDGESGVPLAAAEAVAALFDQNSRRIVAIGAEERERIEARVLAR